MLNTRGHFTLVILQYACKVTTYLFGVPSIGQSGPHPSALGQMNWQVLLIIDHTYLYPLRLEAKGSIMSSMSLLVIGMPIPNRR